MLKGLAAAVFFGARRRGQEREARRGLQPGDVRSSLRRAAAGEGAEAHDLQPGGVLGACRSGRTRWGARSAVRRRSAVFLGACPRGRRRGGLRLYQLRAAWGATGQLSGIWLGLWVSASGGVARTRRTPRPQAAAAGRPPLQGGAAGRRRRAGYMGSTPTPLCDLTRLWYPSSTGKSAL